METQVASLKQQVRRTNTGLVTDLMDYSQHGALSQMFIIDAIRKFADAVASTPLVELRERFGHNSMISADSWHGVATEIKREMDTFYGDK